MPRSGSPGTNPHRPCPGAVSSDLEAALAAQVDVDLPFPFLLFAVALVSVVGPSLTVSILVIAFFSWAAVGRLVRGQTLTIKEREYVEAARSLGANDRRILFVDVLPNLLAPVIIYATLLLPTKAFGARVLPSWARSRHSGRWADSSVPGAYCRWRAARSQGCAMVLPLMLFLAVLGVLLSSSRPRSRGQRRS